MKKAGGVKKWQAVLTAMVTMLLVLSCSASAEEITWLRTFDAGQPYRVPLAPDANSAYSVFPWDGDTEVGRNLVVKISGQYPYSRYFSYNLYDFAEASTIEHITDYQIRPDADSRNPFQPDVRRSTGNRNYTMWFVPGTQEENGRFFNDPDFFRNVFYMNKEGRELLTPTIMLRIYRPDDGMDINGGVPLPEIELFSLDPDTGELWPVFERPEFSTFSVVFNLVTQVLSKKLPVEIKSTIRRDSIDFYRFDAAGLMPNGDNKYIGAGLSTHWEDQVAVVRFTPPTFIDTSDTGEHHNYFPYEQPETRFFSINMSGALSTLTSHGLCDVEFLRNPDGSFKTDADGKIVVVIAPDTQYLRDKAREAGFNFLARGVHTQPVVVLRHMCARYSEPPEPGDFVTTPNFVPKYSIQNLLDAKRDDWSVTMEDYLASNVMEEYAATGEYYTITEFVQKFAPPKIIQRVTSFFSRRR